MRHLVKEVIIMRYICFGLSFWLTLVVLIPHFTTYSVR